MNWRSGFLLGLCLVPLTAACSTEEDERLDDLAAARSRWIANTPGAYDFNYLRSCFCPDVFPARVYVVDGVVTLVRNLETSTPLPEERNDDFPTVDQLFNELDALIRLEPTKPREAMDWADRSLGGGELLRACTGLELGQTRPGRRELSPRRMPAMRWDGSACEVWSTYAPRWAMAMSAITEARRSPLRLLTASPMPCRPAPIRPWAPTLSGPSHQAPSRPSGRLLSATSDGKRWTAATASA